MSRRDGITAARARPFRGPLCKCACTHSYTAGRQKTAHGPRGSERRQKEKHGIFDRDAFRGAAQSLYCDVREGMHSASICAIMSIFNAGGGG